MRGLQRHGFSALQTAHPWPQDLSAAVQGLHAQAKPPAYVIVAIRKINDAAAKVAELGDDGTNDLIVSDFIRTGEMQSWFLVEHLVDTPLVRA